jgi:hypothetical protein
MYVQNMYISHVCIVINDGCELKCICTWMNVNKWNSSTIIKHHWFVSILHSPTCYYLTHITINNTKPSTHSFMWLKLIHIGEIINFLYHYTCFIACFNIRQRSIMFWGLKLVWTTFKIIINLVSFGFLMTKFYKTIFSYIFIGFYYVAKCKIYLNLYAYRSKIYK